MPFYKTLDDAMVVDDTTFTGATSATMQVIFDLAVSTGLPVRVRPGIYDVGNTTILGPITVRATPGTVTFRLAAASSYILYLSAFTFAQFDGIVFDGQNLAMVIDPFFGTQGLVNLRRDSGTLISKASFQRCTFKNST